MDVARQRALRGFVSLGSGLPREAVCPGNDGAPRPGQAYATLLVVREGQVGYADAVTRCTDDGDARELIIELWEARVSLQFFRDGAHDRARQFAAFVDSPLGRLAEERMGLREPAAPDQPWAPREFTRMALTGVLTYRQIDSIVGEEWEERAGIDFEVQYLHQFNQAVGPIEEVPVVVNGENLRIGVS